MIMAISQSLSNKRVFFHQWPIPTVGLIIAILVIIMSSPSKKNINTNDQTTLSACHAFAIHPWNSRILVHSISQPTTQSTKSSCLFSTTEDAPQIMTSSSLSSSKSSFTSSITTSVNNDQTHHDNLDMTNNSNQVQHQQHQNQNQTQTQNNPNNNHHNQNNNNNNNKKNLTTSDVLSLDSIRASLIRQEETIIFALIERAQFRHNPIVYQRGGLGPLGTPPGSQPKEKEKEEDLSFLEYMLVGTEALHCAVRRYTSPEEHGTEHTNKKTSRFVVMMIW
jgi:hypothetical protein